MEANEIRLGNIVEYMGKIQPVTIEIIRECELNNATTQPIPLNNGLLDRFRFKFDHYGEIRKGDFIIELFDDGYHYTGGEGVSFGVPIEYVHHLQNLYYDLNGEELTIQPLTPSENGEQN